MASFYSELLEILTKTDFDIECTYKKLEVFEMTVIKEDDYLVRAGLDGKGAAMSASGLNIRLPVPIH